MGKQSTTPSPRHTGIPRRIALLLLLVLSTIAAQAQTAASANTTPLLLPSAVVFDAQGNLYIAETASHVIRKLDTTGTLTTIAGTGTQGFSGDNGPATAAELDSPQGLALDANQNLYLADTHNHRIRKINLTTGIITTIAGTGIAGFSGDNGPATSAQLNLPTALATDTAGDLYLADTQNHRIRRIAATTGQITTIAGNGTQGFTGDNGPATSASIDSPTGIAVDTANNVYLADTHNQRIRRITATTGQIATIAGTGAPGYTGDNAAATGADLALPHGLSFDATGNLYLADTRNHRIRRIDVATGIITTIAGDGTQAFAGDNGPAASASLDSPRAVVAAPVAPLTIADTGNQRIRQLDSAANLHTIAGPGAAIPGALTLSAPSVIPYGTGQVTATLAGTAATGPITFLDLTSGIATALGTAALSTNTSLFSTAALPAGTHTLIAVYAGDATHAGVQSAPITLRIAPQPLTATIASVTLLYGQPIPLLTGTLNGVLPQDAASLSTTFTTPASTLSPPGAYPITTILAGPAAGNYTLAATPATLTIAQAPVHLSLTASTPPPGLPPTLTIHVASTTAGTPTGTLTLLDNAATLYTAVASPTDQLTFTPSALTPGSHTLTALYSGDVNFTPASASTIVVFGGKASDFTLSSTGTTNQTILPGDSASFAFTVAIQGDPLSSPVALSATGLPNLATASFNPAYLPPGATSNTFNLTIKTPATTARNRTSAIPTLLFAILFLPIAGVTVRKHRHPRLPTLLTFLLLATALTLCSGCGDRINPGNLTTPAAIPYSVTVTGTATTPTGAILQHSATVTLLIQPTN